MEVRIKINCDNAAFGDGMASLELARILHKLADRVAMDDEMPYAMILMDVNGNRVGIADTKGERPE